MVVVMKEKASDTEVEAVIAQLVVLGMDVHRSTGASRVVLGVVGGGKVDPRLFELMAGVHEVVRITQPYKLASRTFQAEDTIVTIGDLRIGADEVIVIAGPCSAESEAQVHATAAAVKRAGEHQVGLAIERSGCVLVVAVRQRLFPPDFARFPLEADQRILQRHDRQPMAAPLDRQRRGIAGGARPRGGARQPRRDCAPTTFTRRSCR